LQNSGGAPGDKKIKRKVIAGDEYQSIEEDSDEYGNAQGNDMNELQNKG
jgi:hypothetical protein